MQIIRRLLVENARVKINIFIKVAHIISTNKTGIFFFLINWNYYYHTVLYIASCTAASTVMRNEFRHVSLAYLFRISLFKHFLFYYFLLCLLVVFLATIDYFWLLLRKLCKMWNSKHFGLQVNKTLSACKIYIRN